MKTATKPISFSVGVIVTGATCGIKQLVKDFGGSSERVFRNADLSPNLSLDLGNTISLERYAALLEAAAIESKNQNFGFVFGSRFDTRMLGQIGYVLTFSKTVGDALDYFCQNLSSQQGNSQMCIDCSGETCQLVYKIHDLEIDKKAQDAETTIGMMQSFCRRVVGAGWHCKDVQFEHATRAEDGLKKRFLGVTPNYGAEHNAIIFDKKFLETPIVTYDPTLLDMVVGSLDEARSRQSIVQQFVGETGRCIVRLLRAGHETSLASIAAEIGMSSRAMQNRLVARGVSFRQIKSEVTLDFAKDMLTYSDCSITKISHQLMFSESSAFSRAYKIRFGITPSQQRNVALRTR